MANERIIDLTPLVTQTSTDLYETSANGTGSFKESRAQLLAYMQANIATAPYTIGDVIYASSTTALGKISDIAVGNALLSGGIGVVPSWGKIGLTTHVSGILGFTNGGFGFNTATMGDLFYASAANTPGGLAAVATGSVLASGGIGASPQWSTFPTISRIFLTNGSVPISGINAVIEISSAASDGTYLSLGGAGRTIGQASGGNLFFATNLNYNASVNSFAYSASAGASSIELSTTGGLLKYAPVGVAGDPVTPTISLSWDISGNINIPALTASSPVFTDASKNLISVPIIPIANGGTNSTSFQTNGINYFDGTSIVNSTDLTWDGATLTAISSGASAQFNVQTNTTGIANFAISHVARGDSAFGLAGFQFDSGGIGRWLNGMYPATASLTADANDLIFRSFNSSTVVMSLGYTSYDATIHNGDLIINSASKTIQINSLNATELVVTDGSKKLISGGAMPLGINAIVTISSSTQSLSLQKLYVNTYAGGVMTGTLPSATGTGKTIQLIAASTASTSGWVINAVGSDKIQFNGTLGAAAGSITSTIGSATDCVTLIDAASNLWIVYPAGGLNLTVA